LASGLAEYNSDAKDLRNPSRGDAQSTCTAQDAKKGNQKRMNRVFFHVPTLADYVAFAGSITTGDKQLLCLQQPSKFDSHPGHQFREKQKDLGTDGGA
jgi:hypothetical protein